MPCRTNAILKIIVLIPKKLQLNSAESFEKRFGKVAYLRFDTSHTTAPTLLDSDQSPNIQLCTMMRLSITRSIQAHSPSKKSLNCLSIRGDNPFWSDLT